MNYGKVEEPNSSRNRYPSTARRAATSAILTVTLSRSDRAPNSRTVNARPGWDADLNAGAQRSPILARVGPFASPSPERLARLWRKIALLGSLLRMGRYTANERNAFVNTGRVIVTNSANFLEAPFPDSRQCN